MYIYPINEVLDEEIRKIPFASSSEPNWRNHGPPKAPLDETADAILKKLWVAQFHFWNRQITFKNKIFYEIFSQSPNK